MSVNPILDAFGEIAREKSIGREELVEMIEAGLVAAARKKYGQGCEVDVEIDPLGGSIDIHVGREVVEEVEDPTGQITLAEARELDSELELGDIHWEQVPFTEFGRNAIQAAKQVVIQRIRESERDKIRAEYSGKIGELLSGSIQQVERGNYVIFLNKQTEAILPMKETNRKDYFKQGDPIRAVLIDIRETTKGPQLILSRTNEAFLRALFQIEVPEIYQGIIEIKGVVREAGNRSKIAVSSNDEHIDPVGACVGLKGSRVQSVVNELGGERIDVIPYSDDPQEFVRSSLNPAKLYRTSIDRDEHTVTAVIEDEQLSLAIGRNGQNVRLASQLTGWKIELMEKKEFMAQRDEMLTGVFGKSDEGQGGQVQEKSSDSRAKAEEMFKKKPAEPVEAEKAEVKADEKEAVEAETVDLGRLSEEQQELIDDLPVEDFPVELIDSFTPSLREKLEEAGYDTFYKLVLAPEQELTGIKGIGKQTAAKIKEMIDFLVEHYEQEYNEDED
ncbi:MAG: transcription termination factor NusA [Candidatus Glassbacteria bacterium]|nr:transcription termination factor NusA [Candidatus Glassbacteria bacterium]